MCVHPPVSPVSLPSTIQKEKKKATDKILTHSESLRHILMQFADIQFKTATEPECDDKT